MSIETQEAPVVVVHTHAEGERILKIRKLADIKERMGKTIKSRVTCRYNGAEETNLEES